ncbi:MAG TPA: DUF11 domain-containing protein, partial [Dehalococcoidia bacterium]|nr:DUF11 domain-containing protein [Dehalococcoidia bacterium]
TADLLDNDGSDIVTCTLTSTPPGIYDIIINVTAPDGDPVSECGAQTNQAEITAGVGDGDTAEDTVEVVCPADIDIDKDPSTGSVSLGGTFTYDIQVENTGDSLAENVVVTDNLTGNGEIIDISVSPGSPACESSNNFPCNLGDIAAGDSVTITVTVRAGEDDCDPINNSATASADGGIDDTDSTGNLVNVTGCEEQPTPPTPTPPTPTPPTQQVAAVQATPTAPISQVLPSTLPKSGSGGYLPAEGGSTWFGLSALVLAFGVSLLLFARLSRRSS